MDASDICPAFQNEPEETHVYVSVHDIGGDHYSGDASVFLRQDDVEKSVQRVEGTILYEGYVAPGTYILDVTVPNDDLIAPFRLVEIPAGGKTASVYLGRKDWPTYRLGENIVPFEPHEDLLAVVFETNKVPPDLALAVATDAARQVGIELYDNPAPSYDKRAPSTDLSFTAANSAIWLFQLPDLDADHRSEVTEGLRAFLSQAGHPARVGTPVDLKSGQVKVLDNRFVVRFKPWVQDIELIARQAGARVRRGFIQAPNTRLLEFEQGGMREHLETIERWFSQDLLIYGEPDLLAEITSTGFPYSDPQDGSYADQTNLPLQHINAAWQFLNTLDADHHRTLGCPSVYVATLDVGMQPDHPDVGGNLTDGVPQLVAYHDLRDMMDCLADGASCTADWDHGMGVYGIIAARTNNKVDHSKPGERAHGNIAGIAPNTHQIAIKRPDVGSVLYNDVLLWIAGFQPKTVEAFCEEDDFPANWPHRYIIHGADIINCSHVAKNLACAGLTSDTLTFLTTYGRHNLGTVVIYGAPDVRACITGTEAWTTHRSTITVSNTSDPTKELDLVERLATNSGFGPEIDLCARGAGVWSLNDRGGAMAFDGTSASAPTVAAAAALILSVNPHLTWREVRQILCDNAEQIDPCQNDPDGKWTLGPNPFSWFYGYGRLRVLEALIDACNRARPGICRPEHLDHVRPA